MAASKISSYSCIVLILLQCIFIARTIHADEFIIPSNAINDLSLSFDLGQIIQISWQTELEVVTLLVSHWGGNAVGTLLSAEENPGFLEWTIGENDNIDDEAIKENSNFVLLIRDPAGIQTDGNGFVNGQLSSRAFVVNSNETSSTTSTSFTSSISSTSTTSTAPPTATNATTSTTPIPAETTSDLTTLTKVGIGIGAGITGLTLLALGIWLGLRRSRRSSQQPPSQTPPQFSARYEIDGHGQSKKAGLYLYKSQQEQGHYAVVEMPENALKTVVGVHEMGDGRER